MGLVKRKEKPKKQALALGEEQYIRRAMAAYFRSGGSDAPIPANTSTVEEHKGKFYVELHNVNGTLAVYRIRTDGMLKKMKRWPKEITVEGEVDQARGAGRRR